MSGTTLRALKYVVIESAFPVVSLRPSTLYQNLEQLTALCWVFVANTQLLSPKHTPAQLLWVRHLSDQLSWSLLLLPSLRVPQKEEGVL